MTHCRACFVLLCLVLAVPAAAQDATTPEQRFFDWTTLQFDEEVYRQRREKLMDQMGEGIAVLYARGSHDREDFVPDGDFYYLTGLAEEDAVLILAPGDRKAGVAESLEAAKQDVPLG